MTVKPTYKELEQRVKELKKFVSRNEWSEESFLGGETLFRAIAEQSGEGISLADTDGNYVFINPAFCIITGYNEAELAAMNVADLLPPEIELSLFPQVAKKESGKRVLELVKKNGSRFIAEVSGYPVKLGEQLLVLGIVRDVSEQRQVEERVRESEIKHKTLVNNIPGMVYRVYSDWSAEVISGSKEVCGYTNEELNSKESNWLSIIHPDDRENVFKQGSEFTKSLKEVVQTYRIITKDGNIRWIEDRKTSLFSEKGDFKGIDGIVFDITNRRKVEEALQESEKTARALLDASTESAFLMDIDGTYVQMNEITAKKFGKNIEELLGKCAFDFLPSEIAKSRKEIVKEIVLNKQPVRFQDERSGIIFDNNLNPIFDIDGNVVRVAIFARDITKQKQPEEALRASEQKYKLLAENSTDVIYKLNLETEQYSYASPSAERIFGYRNEEILDLKGSDTITPESYAQQREKLEAAMLQGKNDPEILEMEVLHKEGRVIPVEVHARILYDKQGVPREILGIARDITWRKEAELALKKSEERYKFLAENMGDVVWTVDMDLSTTYISPSVEKVLGYTPEERKKQKLEEMVTPETLDHIRSILVEELERDKLPDIDPDRSITIEVEYYQRDGTIIWMENQIKAIRNQAGEIIGMYGVSRDITDRKRAEEIIRESQEKLRSIVEHANELFYIHNIDHDLIYVSPASKDIFGYSPEEMMRKWTELTSDNPINQKGLEITEKAMMTGQRQVPYLLEAIKKDGTFIMLEINESPIKDSQGKVVGITGAARDVTEKIKAEQALKKAHDELEQKVKGRTRELSIANENMQQEIRERKMAEEALHEQEKKLKLQASRLEEMNTALKILLEHREDEKTKLKEGILLNMEKLVMPHLDKLASSIPNGHDNTYLNIIRTNIEGLVSPFAQELSSRRLNLTPSQMQVADFIRNGFTNKEIASHLNISVDAVSFHRKNIRKRLGLTNRKSNLRSYLQQLSDIKR